MAPLRAAEPLRNRPSVDHLTPPRQLIGLGGSGCCEGGKMLSLWRMVPRGRPMRLVHPPCACVGPREVIPCRDALGHKEVPCLIDAAVPMLAPGEMM